MKVLLYIILAVPAVIMLWFAFLSITSRQYLVAGLVDGQLTPCPGTPNCVCSEFPQSPAYVEPLVFTAAPDKAWYRVKNVLVEKGGVIHIEQGDYLHALFTTRLFRFIDDVELRLDRANRRIHVRSASRVGHSDLGLNKYRIELIRMAFAEQE